MRKIILLRFKNRLKRHDSAKILRPARRGLRVLFIGTIFSMMLMLFTNCQQKSFSVSSKLFNQSESSSSVDDPSPSPTPGPNPSPIPLPPPPPLPFPAPAPQPSNWSQTSLPIIVSEALIPAVNDAHGSVFAKPKATVPADRTNEILRQGIPLPDSWGVSGSNPQLGFVGSGAPTVGQFNCLKQWKSGNCQWVLVSTLVPSLAAATSKTLTLTVSGSGNFGGSNMATDNGTTITVNTGGASFVVKKSNYNVFDSVSVGAKTLVTSGSSDGIVMVGPAADGTTTSCAVPLSGCTTDYKSKNDPNSTVTIVENGPVSTVLKASGRLMSGTQKYINYVNYMYFSAGSSSVKMTPVLINADEDHSPGGGFKSAYKMYRSAEIRIAMQLAGGNSARFSTDSNSISSYNFSGSEMANKIQGYTSRFQPGSNLSYADPCPNGSGCTLPPMSRTFNSTTNRFDYDMSGLSIFGNSSLLYSANRDAYDDAFWGDVSDSSGSGAMTSVFHGNAYWPKSLEFRNGGSDLRIGLWPDQSTWSSAANKAYPYSIPWPNNLQDDVFIHFHGNSSAVELNSAALRFQSPLMARPPFSYVDFTAVYPVAITDPREQDEYIKFVAATADPVLSSLWNDNLPKDMAPSVLYQWGWGGPGGDNMTEARWDHLIQFYRRGWTGRVMWAKSFYKHIFERVLPRTNGENLSGGTGFRWTDHSRGGPANLSGNFSDINTITYPTGIFNNSQNKTTSWGPSAFCDGIHCHIYGVPDWYYFSGDYVARDFTENELFDQYSSQKCYNLFPGAQVFTYTCTGNDVEDTSRGVGSKMMGMAREYDYFSSPGPTHNSSKAADVAAAQDQIIQFFINDIEVSGTGPAGSNRGVSRTRGIFYPNTRASLFAAKNAASFTPGYCGAGTNNDGTPMENAARNIRGMQPYQQSVALQGLEEVLRARGPAWSFYRPARDSELGMLQWAMFEMSRNNGSGKWRECTSNCGDSRSWFSYNGIRYAIGIDFVSNPAGTSLLAGPCETQLWYAPSQTVWFNWGLYAKLTGDTSVESTMRFNLQRLIGGGGASNNVDPNVGIYDLFGYNLSNAIHQFSNPGLKLLTVPLTNFQSNGGGSYTLTWAAPSGVQAYTLKYVVGKQLVDWLHFNPDAGSDAQGLGGQWGLDPATHHPWFSANYTGTQPASSATSITVTGLPVGLVQNNFMLKSYTP